MATAAVLLLVRDRASADSTTNSNDNLLTSWYPNQPALSPQTVADSSFGQLASTVVDGQVYAQPLVSNGVLIVATENNQVYGLNQATGAVLWNVGLGAPFVPNKYFSTSNQCGDITPDVGVTSTPVVDPSTGVVYLTSKVLTDPADQSSVKYVMHALSVTTGAEQTQLGFPVTLGGTADNDSTHVFTAPTELQRPGLLLMNGVVYAAFGGHCDNGPYEGWVLGVSASRGLITARWSDEAGVPQSGGGQPAGGGIWHAGGGILSDGPGQLILASGNGHTPSSPAAGSTPPGSLAQSVFRLSVQPDGTLKTTDFFSPYNGASLNANDSDIGSGPPIGLPGPDVLPGSPFGTAAHPHVFVQVGKAGYIFLLDAQNMGGFDQGPAGSDADINAVQGYGVWGKPSVWPGDGGWVYMVTAQGGGGSGALRAYKSSVDGAGNPTLALQGRSNQLFGYGSSPAIVTSDGMTSGSAVVWTVWEPDASGANAQLQAYLPVPSGGTLAQIGAWPVGTANKFTPPTADSGRIYVGTRDGRVLIFGTPVNAALTANAVNFPTTVVGSSSTATATLTATQPLTVTSLTSTSSQFSVGTATPALPASLNTGDQITVPVTFTPGTIGTIGGTLVAQTSDGATAKVPLSGQGESAGPHLAVYPCCISFGGVPVGSSQSNSVTLTNDGAATLTINSVDLPTAPYSVSGLPPAGATMASGESVTATVTFAPASVGEYTNELTVATDGGNTSISLDGSGGTAPQMTLSTTSLEYGSVPTGVTATETFVVRNTGGTPMTLTKSKPPQGAGGFSADPASIDALAEGTVIQPGARVTARVNFTPGATGQATTAWVLNADDGQGERSVTFDGTGAAPPVPTIIVGNVDVTVPATGTTTANFPAFFAPGATGAVTDNFVTHDGSAKASAGVYVPTSSSGVPATVSPGATTIVPITVNSSSVSMTNVKFYLDPKTTAGVLNGVNGIAWLNTTPTTHNFILPEPVSTWRSPSENTTVRVPIILESPSASSVKITVTTSDGTAVSGTDYVGGISQTITLQAGQTEYDLPVQILAGDLGGTTPKTFNVSLSGASGPTKVALTTAAVTIYPPSANVSTPPPPTPLTWLQDTPSTNATVGSKYAYSFAASGDPSPTFALASGSALPPGVDLDATGILAGTPTQSGDYTFAVVASNGVSPDIVSPSITLHVAAMPVAPAFTSASPPANADLGTPYSYTFVATGQPAPTFSVSSGSLPAGLSLNSVTGVLSGTPTTSGTSTFTVAADNGIDVPAQTGPLSITVSTGMSFTSASSATGYLGQPFTFTVATSASPTATVSLSSGTLPGGLTFTANNDGTATISGTVTATDPVGSTSLVFKAINGVNSPITQSFTLTVAAAADLKTTMSGPPTVSAGSQVTYTVTATNAGPSSITSPITSVFYLPSGTSFVTADNGGTLAAGTVTWTVAKLGSGAHVNLKVTLVDSTKGTDVATAASSCSVYDPNTANNTASWTNTVR